MTQTIEPVRKEIVVECPQERAFRVFTQRIDAWWPRDYHIGKAEMQTACVEERVGGRIFERGVDGVESPWGKVLVWEPPRRFVWAWQITAQWQYDPEFVTEIEVIFTAEGPQRTRVQLEHRYLDRYGDAAEAMRKTMNEGWAPMLAGYASVANG